MRKLVLLCLLATATALGLVILFERNTNAPAGLFSVFCDVALGVSVGAGSRFVLRRRYWLIRALASAGLSAAGLVIVGQLTAHGAGVGLLQGLLIVLGWLSRLGVRLPQPLAFGAAPLDLKGTAHLVLAVTVSWITLRAWSGASKLTEAPTSTGLPQKMMPDLPVESWTMASVPAVSPQQTHAVRRRWRSANMGSHAPRGGGLTAARRQRRSAPKRATTLKTRRHGKAHAASQSRSAVPGHSVSPRSARLAVNRRWALNRSHGTRGRGRSIGVPTGNLERTPRHAASAAVQAIGMADPAALETAAGSQCGTGLTGQGLRSLFRARPSLAPRPTRATGSLRGASVPVLS